MGITAAHCPASLPPSMRSQSVLQGWEIGRLSLRDLVEDMLRVFTDYGSWSNNFTAGFGLERPILTQ